MQEMLSACADVVLCVVLQVPNASPTAGSASTDLYGMAVLDACRQINERLRPYRWALHYRSCRNLLCCSQHGTAGQLSSGRCNRNMAAL